MKYGIRLVIPKVLPPLDENFRPAVLANHHFRCAAGIHTSPLVIAIERDHGEVSRFATNILPHDHPDAWMNAYYIERIIKFLLWQRGGFRIYIGGSIDIGNYISQVYSHDGRSRFDHQFMSRQVYEKPFEVISCPIDEVPEARESGKLIGRHLDGCRIGFDLGASDRKVSAVQNGQVVFSEEIIWEPRKKTDPLYHDREIRTMLNTAAAHLPRVDAIGGSSAGIYIENRPMVASLFRNIAEENFPRVRDLFINIQREMGVPLVIINDGDVTALAGSMSLNENGILGIAMGSSEAAGYVDQNGHITGWLNELSFAPVDYNPAAPEEEWSGDMGCGASYLSQQCVFRLASLNGLILPDGTTDAEKLAFAQEKLESGNPIAKKIWETMGVYLGYSLAHYADFYDMQHVLILGRCTSGSGGEILLDRAEQVFREEFQELQTRIKISLPDEKSRRVGQSIAAASLPEIHPVEEP